MAYFSILPFFFSPRESQHGPQLGCILTHFHLPQILLWLLQLPCSLCVPDLGASSRETRLLKCSQKFLYQYSSSMYCLAWKFPCQKRKAYKWNINPRLPEKARLSGLQCQTLAWFIRNIQLPCWCTLPRGGNDHTVVHHLSLCHLKDFQMTCPRPEVAYYQAPELLALAHFAILTFVWKESTEQERPASTFWPQPVAWGTLTTYQLLLWPV